MNNVHPCLHSAIGSLVLSGQHQKSDRGRVEHLSKARNSWDSGRCLTAKFLPWQLHPFANEILQVLPLLRAPVPNEYSTAPSAVRHWNWSPLQAGLGGFQ